MVITPSAPWGARVGMRKAAARPRLPPPSVRLCPAPLHRRTKVDTVLAASAQWILAASIHRVQHPVILLKVLLANVVVVRMVESVHQATIVLKVLVKNVDQTRKVLTQTKDALLVL